VFQYVGGYDAIERLADGYLRQIDPIEICRNRMVQTGAGFRNHLAITVNAPHRRVRVQFLQGATQFPATAPNIENACRMSINQSDDVWAISNI